MPRGKRVEVPKSEHGIDPALVDERAAKVVSTLAAAGFEAYIVGGAVRDLILGLRPKDFDVATNATPEEVKGLFRRAFIIGRRFRIVHVVFGRGRQDRGLSEVIEVSTFRAFLDASAAEQVEGNDKTSRTAMAGKSHVVDASGRVLRDNVWGPQSEDAARRDFTINAMYYDPVREVVVDYHGGIKDAKKKLLRMIGDPATRYREDPVRIIRVVRFAAKLGFEIEPKTRAPIKEMAALLDNVPPSRTFDEMIKLLQTGHALASIVELRKQGLHRGVFPVLDVALDEAQRHDGREKFVQLALADTDARVANGRPVAPSFMLASMLWHDVQSRWQQQIARRRAGLPGAAAGDRRGVRCAHRRHLGPRSTGRRHARDLDDAAAARTARRQCGADDGRAAALSRRSRLPAAARRGGRSRSGAGALVGRLCRKRMPTSATACSNALRGRDGPRRAPRPDPDGQESPAPAEGRDRRAAEAARRRRAPQAPPSTAQAGRRIGRRA